VAPFAKTGGLTDVAGSLPKALAARGHEVRIAMPCYARIKEKDSLTDLPVEMDGSLETVIIRKTHLGDIPVYIWWITINISAGKACTVTPTTLPVSIFL